ncbi:MAG TPA: ATP-binding protein [bacterium]|nr:ATP-binding protein [bacterium]
MNKEVLKQVIIEGQESKLPDIITRDMEIPLSSRKIITVTGPRRSGKTYLLFLVMKNLLSQGIPRAKIIYINFDDPRLLPSSGKEIELVLEAYRELYPEYREDMVYLFLDEVQNIKDWELGIRRLYDTRQFQIFLTGSSSKLLSKDIATQLRGRAINYELLPFSFREILWSRGITEHKNLSYSQDRFLVKKYLEEYLEMGGFPEVILETGREIKTKILREYVETIFFRDLIERYNIRNQVMLRELIRYLSTNTATVFSLNSFYKWIRNTYPITLRTLLNYVTYLEDIGLFFFIRRYSFSLKEQAKTLRKPYIVDNGIRYAYGFRFSEDKGKTLENSVFLELKHKKTKDPFMDIYYWNDYRGKEIDFVVTKGENIRSLIQVCANIEDIKVRGREVSALIKGYKELNCKDLLIITLDYEKEESIEGLTVRFIPFWKWAIDF